MSSKTQKVPEKVKNGKSLVVPNWIISSFKFMGPVVVALAIGYARFTAVENHVSINEQKIQASTTKQEAMDLIVQGVDRRLNTTEVKQQVLEKDLTASLARIELTIKDVQTDVKEMQKTHK